jgi:hypothetical protein
MNPPDQTTIAAVSGHTADWQPRPALREAMRMIATITVDDSTALISDRSITFQNSIRRTACGLPKSSRSARR